MTNTPDTHQIEIRDAETGDGVEMARELFREYASTIGGHICFQSFEAELAGLPGEYSAPRGRLYVAFVGGRLAGCIALRPAGGDACEMKRLWVRPEFRRYGLGRLLTERLLEDAKAIGYSRINLDTLDTMQAAHRLYESLGFVDYRPAELALATGVRYMTRPLR